MSPRGFQVDIPATLLRFGGKRWKPGTTFVSKPKIIKGECTEPKAHLLLIGEDKASIRAEIFRRNREENDGENRCWNCGTSVFEIAPDEFCFAYVGEWDHIRNKPGERCDCVENGRVACQSCHLERHPRPRWGKEPLCNSETDAASTGLRR
jgi:hypothetical protein